MSTWCSRSQASSSSRMMGVSFGDNFEDRPVRSKRNVLLEHRDAERALAPHAAGVEGDLSAEDLQQGGLAHPVASDQRDVLARLDLESDVVEERKMSERDRRAVERHPGASVQPVYDDLSRGGPGDPVECWQWESQPFHR